MYQYDQYDQAIVDARVAEFRDQVARRIAGEISEDQFKPLRLMNGLYLQLHAYMLRVAIPYGTMDSRQMRMLATIARKYDRGYGHFTTRQNIQYNWIKLAECPDLLADLATVEMHAFQTSGNCIRNISSDQYAGAAADEVTDPRVWAELLRQWSTLHPEFSFLPRKFKIAVIGSPEDRAAMRLHDIGIEMVERDGVLGGRVFVGGGMGRTPMIAPEIRDFVTADDLLSYVEACLRVYNRYGRRDNIYKARIKILVHELGADEYRRQVEEEFLHVKTLGLDPPKAEFDRISAFFAAPAFESGSEADDGHDYNSPDFAHWVAQNTRPHKQPGYAIVNISLKPIGGIPGDASADQIDIMADLAERFSFDELRVTHAQNITLPHVRKRDLHVIWQTLLLADLATPNLDLVSDIIACPGLDYCSLANARSIPVAQKIAKRFADLDRNVIWAN
jgi:sulfite reductase (NADPH) hemoprotein beta-component